jgi:repressor LexA
LNGVYIITYSVGIQIMHKLTVRQQEILNLIQTVVSRTGMPPTRAEIAAHFGFRSTNAAEKHLQALAKKGAIELLSGASRGIRLAAELLSEVDLSEQQVRKDLARLPLVGRVAAGAPILAEECIEEVISVDVGLFRPAADYLLRVQGLSMRDIGILDGDLLAVHKTPLAENGQVVVARLDGEVTAKQT